MDCGESWAASAIGVGQNRFLHSTFPRMAGLIIAPRARIFHGHEWVYATEIKKSFGDPQPGDVVTLKDFRDRPLGSAIYNPQSQIVARRFSRRRQDLDLDFFTRRIRQAIEFRQRSGIDETLCRLVWSDALVALLAPKSIVLRNDSPFRKAEGMEPGIEMLHGENPGAFIVRSNDLDFEIDIFDGQKTGLYLDQLQSHAEVAKLAKGKRVLDCFTNQGGFALACAKAGAAKVTAVDVSASACEAARHNARLNGLDIEVLEHNVFDFLKHAKPEYDLIILDPPSFTRNKKTLMDAMRGYKEIHLRSLKLLEKGGILSTFCCSHHASRELFLENLADASVDAKKSLRLIAEHSQRADHPVLITIPETGYLKGFTVEVIATR